MVLGNARSRADEFANERAGERDFTPVVVLLVAVLIILSRLVGLLINPDPWLDEAMLLLNFMTIDWSSILKPLPLFEQAAPLGYVILGKSVSVFGVAGAAIAMRCVATAASFATALIFFRLAGQVMPTAWSAVATCMLMMNHALTFYAIEIKQFGIEALCTLGIVYCVVLAARRGADIASLALLAAVGAVSMVFSFTAVLAVAGFGGALFVDRVTDPTTDRRALVRVMVVGLVIASVWALFYFGYARSAVSMHISGYPDRYAEGALQLPPLDETARRRWVGVLRLLENRYLRPLPRPFSLFAFLGLVGLGWAWLLVRGGRVGRLLATGGALFFVTMIAGSVVGVFTPYTERHFLFATPVIALFLASGIMTAVTLASSLIPSRARPGVVAVTMLLLLLAFARPGVMQTVRAEREPISAALARAQREGGWPGETWVLYPAQPAADLAAFPGIPNYLGRVPHESVPTGWFVNAREAHAREVEGFERALANRQHIYLLYSHLTRLSGPLLYHGRELEAVLAAAERLGAQCTLLQSGVGSRGEAGLYRCER